MKEADLKETTLKYNSQPLGFVEKEETKIKIKGPVVVKTVKGWSEDVEYRDILGQ